MFGLHLGVDGYMQRIRKDHVVKDDIQWNYQYYKGIKNTYGSLVYSHVVFGRTVNGLIECIAPNSEVLKKQYLVQFNKRREEYYTNRDVK